MEPFIVFQKLWTYEMKLEMKFKMVINAETKNCNAKCKFYKNVFFYSFNFKKYIYFLKQANFV